MYTLKVLCSYLVNAICKIALLRYLSDFRFQVLRRSPAIYPCFPHETRNNSEQVMEESKESKLKPSFIMSHSTKVISTR